MKRAAFRWQVALGPLALLVAGAVIARPVDGAEYAGWALLRSRVTAPAAVVLVCLAFIVAAVAITAALGLVKLPAIWLRATLVYAVRMLPYWARDAAHGGRIGSGRGNTVYSSEAEFYRGNRRRRGRDEFDFGVHWRDGNRRSARLTWVKPTGELIAVWGGRKGGDRVEVITAIPHEFEVERRLERWAYGGYSKRSLKWARRRAHGWKVPLPPAGAIAWQRDQEPLKPWPVPPLPSMYRDVGTYVGVKGEHFDDVKVVDAEGPRPLYHYVDHSPTGLSWGYAGAGPSDLARSLLADRLGYVPSGAIYGVFRDEVVARLPDDWTLNFKDVDAWIDSHRALFAKYPRGEPFDPYAAGGAY
jgi:hypothetical protein